MNLEASEWVPGRSVVNGCKNTDVVGFIFFPQKMSRDMCTNYRRNLPSGKSCTTQTIGGIELSALSPTRRRGTG